MMTDWLENMGMVVRSQPNWRNPKHLAGRAVRGVAGLGYRLGNKFLSGPTRLKLVRALPGLSGKVESAS
ncbi:MAG: hypothetical protein ACYCXF_09565 [Thermoleophilia bacterium]